jgi:hypothetical protein
MTCFVLTVLDDVKVSFLHRSREAILLITGVWYLKLGIISLVEIK